LRAFSTFHKQLPLVGLAIIFFAHGAYGLDPGRAVNQYARRRWGAAVGFPRGRVDAITQGADGYLWIGTERGLIRFDGQSFKRIEDSGRNGFTLDHILGLIPDDGGGLWVRSLDPSLLRYHNGKFAAARPNPARDPLVTAMSPGRDGSVLFASKVDGLFTWKKGAFQPLIARELLPYSAATSIAETAAGEIWLGTADSGLARAHDKTVQTVTAGLPSLRVTCLLPVATGAAEAAQVERQLYVGTDRGLVLWDGERLRGDGIPAALRTTPIWAMVKDRDGNIWIGAEQGLIRLNSQRLSTFDPGNSLGAVTALFEDREGDLWAGSAGQLERIQESPFATYRPAIPPGRDQGGPVYADSHGDVWAAPDRGALVRVHDTVMTELRLPKFPDDQIYSIAGDRGDLWLGLRRHGLAHITAQERKSAMTTYPQASGASPSPVYAVHQNRDGTIWIGTVGGGATHIQQGRPKTYTTQDGLASNTVFSISEGADGAMWFGTPSGLCSLSENRWRTYRVEDGLPSPNVYATFVDGDGIVWVGTLNGLAYVRSGRLIGGPHDLESALPGGIFGVTQDRLGSLWVVTSGAVFRVDRGKLLSGSLSREDVREFGFSDGLPDLQGVRRSPTISADPSGTIWISRTGGVVSIDPERVRRTAVPTIVHVSQIVVDGAARDLSGPLDLQSDIKRVSIHYEGLNLSSPERIRYRFKLDGFDHGWNESSTNKESVYTNLGPGPYRFHVVASNADQVWNGAEADLSFAVVPAFWQTAWFRAVCVVALIIAAVAAYRLRIYQTTEQVKLQFEARLAERNRIARDLHDTLLQSFQGLLLRFQAVENLLPNKPEQAKKSLEVAIGYAARAITEGRDAVQELRRDEGSGALVEMLTSLGQELGSSSPPEGGQNAPSYRVLLEGSPRPIHPRLQDDLYRISREAVANAFRHARASRIELDIRYDPKMLRIRVRDDGVGMDPNVLARGGREGHWGLPGMQERAKAIKGQLAIWSDLNRGAEIELTVPANIAYMRVENHGESKTGGGGE
jgi:signal transduction histidine kinase/ligand-binding sensor domain-containing protein